MPAAVRIICGPAGSGKTRRLLQRNREVASSSAESPLWLGPTLRAVLAFRSQALAAVPGRLAPNIFTFQDFVEEIIRVNDAKARPLSNLQRRLLADELVADMHARGELPHFKGVIETRGFAETVIELLAELKQNEIWPEQLAGAVDDLAPKKRTGRGSSKDRQCALLYGAYQEKLIAHHLYDLEGRFWYARDLLARGARRPFAAVQAVFVDGFTSFTRTQHDILNALCEWVEELWITLPDDKGEERAELFTRPRATLRQLDHLDPVIETLAAAPVELETNKPAGLAHLERQLFRPVRSVVPAENADGISCIAAPGTVGETRMVARQIKTLLLDGVRPDDILVTMRDVAPYADLVREVFAEYGIPIDVEGTEPVLRNPAVASLLRMLRLPDEDWPFAAVTATFRSGYFCPEWPETKACPEVAQHAEALLRLLGEPRGREVYLKAIHKWAETVQPGLEDEEAEESRRRKIHELAKKCQPFLQRFFQSWDDAPVRATLAEFAGWVRRFADGLGITRMAGQDPGDAKAMHRFWQELDLWIGLEQAMIADHIVQPPEWQGLDLWAGLERPNQGKPRLMERGAFFRMLTTLAAEAGLARTPRGPGRVRILSAELARHLAVPHVFLMGLGERSFPRLTAPVPLFDEQERQAFKQFGLAFPCAADLLPDEMLLFYQVVTRPERSLVLSYAAVDDKGQALLPSSFLSTVRDCFATGVIPEQKRRMLIEGYDRDLPLSAAEFRVQLAASALPVSSVLPPDLAANLAAAADLARQRFHLSEHTPYDGLFRNPAVIAEVQKCFGPERVFSPTALENYIACPFRFFLGNVLRLEPLEEPREEIEGTDRGLAFHRALSRLHTELQSQGIHQPDEAVDRMIMAQLDRAVEECAIRASPASAELWKLEGMRLKRSAERYRQHWKKFVDPWLARGVHPQPHAFEVSFGLPSANGTAPAGPLIIRSEGMEVRISGRIDRVDLADLPDAGGATHGFWIIDYKTGNSRNYVTGDLREFRRLQLTLYALAVQEVLLVDKQARPLGLAYWLVTESGPKIALPAYPRHVGWFEETRAWQTIREQLQRWVVQVVASIRQGAFPLKPRSPDCTQTCDFSQVCRISQSRATVEKKTWQLPLPVIP